jgi:hypothetical protein
MFISIYLSTVFYLHIDIFKSLNILYFDIVISASKTRYTMTVYTTVFPKMNFRFRNM